MCVCTRLCISVMFLHLSETIILLMLFFLVIRLSMKLLKLLFYLMYDSLGSRGENEAIFSCDAWGSCSAFSSKHWRGISIIFHLINLCQSYFDPRIVCSADADVEIPHCLIVQLNGAFSNVYPRNINSYCLQVAVFTCCGDLSFFAWFYIAKSHHCLSYIWKLFIEFMKNSPFKSIHFLHVWYAV